jgi:hypothetical protein
MAFRPNYRQERAQKSRAKEERKQEKLKKLEEASQKRKAMREAESGADPAATVPEAGDTTGDKARE